MVTKLLRFQKDEKEIVDEGDKVVYIRSEIGDETVYIEPDKEKNLTNLVPAKFEMKLVSYKWDEAKKKSIGNTVRRVCTEWKKIK